MAEPTRASKLIELTDYTTESQFFVSCDKIIKVVPQGMGDTLITYIGQSEKVLTKNTRRCENPKACGYGFWSHESAHHWS